MICVDRLTIDARSLTLDSREALRDCSRLTLREPSRELAMEELPVALIGLLTPLPVVVFRRDDKAFSRSRRLFSRANS